MANYCPPFHLRRSVLALAVCAAWLPAQGQTDKAESPTEDVRTEQASVSLGVGALNGTSADRALFGQYNGLRSRSGAVGLLGIDYSLRDDANSNWVQFQGSNLL